LPRIVKEAAGFGSVWNAQAKENAAYAWRGE